MVKNAPYAARRAATLLLPLSLIVAPALTSIMWKSMFDKFEPLDAKALMHAHIENLFDKEERP